MRADRLAAALLFRWAASRRGRVPRTPGTADARAALSRVGIELTSLYGV
ncbi:hypothetical protein [Streptomyces sp. c-19]